MYKELLDLFEDAVDTTPSEAIELFATEVLEGMVKEAEDLSQAEIGIGTGAKAGVLQGAVLGAAGGALQGKLRGIGMLKPTLAGAGMGALFGPISGAVSGGIHGAVMDEAERKALRQGEEYDPVAAGRKVGLIGGAINMPPYQLITVPAGYLVGDKIGKKYKEQESKNAFYSDLLNGFEKVAVELSNEELELFADEVLEEMVKEAGGFFSLRKEHDLAVDELDREYLALKQQDDGRAKQRLDIFMRLAGREPNREERKALQDLATKEFWATIDKVAPNHAALQEYMVSKDPRFHRKDTALDAAGLAGGLGAAVGGSIGATTGIAKNVFSSSGMAARDILGSSLKSTLRGAGAGGALGAVGGALLGYAAGIKPDKDALIRLENKSAFYSDLLNGFEKVAAELSDEELEVLSSNVLEELTKEAFPKIMNPKQFVDSLRTGVKSSQQATDNAVNAAGAAAQKTTKTTKAETNKIKNKPEGSFIKRHPYVSTLAGVGVGATIPGITSAVQQAGATAAPPMPLQQPRYYQ